MAAVPPGDCTAMPAECSVAMAHGFATTANEVWGFIASCLEPSGRRRCFPLRQPAEAGIASRPSGIAHLQLTSTGRSVTVGSVNSTRPGGERRALQTALLTAGYCGVPRPVAVLMCCVPGERLSALADAKATSALRELDIEEFRSVGLG